MMRKRKTLLKKKKPQALAFVLPDGQKVSLLEIREMVIERTAWLGYSPKHQRTRLKKVYDDFDRVKRAVELTKKGLNYEAVAELIKAHPGTVKNWLNGRSLPKSISLKQLRAFQRARKPVKIKKKNHPDFAYVLGAMFAQKGRRKRTGKSATSHLGLLFSSENPAIIEKFKARTEAASGIKPQTVKEKKYLQELAFGRNLTQVINRSTNYLSQLPEEFLKTRPAKKAFLEGLFDSSGTIKYTQAKTPYFFWSTPDKFMHGFAAQNLRALGVQFTTAQTSIGKGKGKKQKQPRQVIRLNQENLLKLNQALGLAPRKKR